MALKREHGKLVGEITTQTINQQTREKGEGMSFEDESIVGGRRLQGSINDFISKCERVIMDEQKKHNQDNNIISACCDGVRLAREYCDNVKSRLIQ